MSLVAYGESSGSEDEGDQSISLNSNEGDKAQDVRRLLSVLPGPAKRKNQPVRLAIPSLKVSSAVSSSNLRYFPHRRMILRILTMKMNPM